MLAIGGIWIEKGKTIIIRRPHRCEFLSHECMLVSSIATALI
jgi:hypothetical protein